jgi:two-component sensor histidine kinase
MKYCFLLFFLISSLWAEKSNQLVLNGTEQHVKLTPHVTYYMDKTSKLNQHTILSKDREFKKSDKEQMSFGHQYSSTLWVKFTLKNSAENSLNYIFEYASPAIYSFSLYTEEELLGSAGYYEHEKFKKNLGHSIKISLPKKSTTTYYMKVNNPVSSMKLNLSLWDSDEYIADKNSNWNILSLFSGAMFILILYNLMLYFFTKDSSYIYYVLVTFFILHHELYTSGYIFFFPSFVMPATTTSIHIMVLLTFAFVPMFARSFLQLQTLLPRVDAYLKYLPIALVAVTFLTVYDVIPVTLNRLVFILSTTSVVFIAFLALFKGVKQARYYVVGWSAVLISFISMAFNRMGILPFDPETYYLTQGSILFEALIFSIGLAARIRYVKEEKEASDAKLILHQESEKKRLESEVALRTKELTKALSMKNLLLKEVHHRVKNNLQIIISLLRLQSDQFDDKRLEEAMNVSEQRIKAMGSVHEMLYASDDISEIDVKEYFLSLVEEARSAYDIHGNIAVNIKTDISLDMERAIYVGLIINELVNNAYKYAFDSKGGEIDISLELNRGEYILHVKDNGKGGELISSSTSLGMLLVKTLATEQLKGSLNTTTESGISHTIRFKEKEL